MEDSTLLCLCLLLGVLFVCADIRETNNGEETVGDQYTDAINQLQLVPPPTASADKLHRFFLGGFAKQKHHLFYATNKRAKRYQRYHRNDYYDVAFLIDASGSIKTKEFRDGITALQTLITKAKRSTKYAIIVFSEQGEIRSFFKYPSTASAILNATEHQGYRTNTQDALQKCRVDLFMNRTSGVRWRSHRRVLIITDGRSNVKNELTVYRATQLKIYGAEIFVVAIGKYIKGIEEIVGLATSRKWHVFRMETMEGFLEVVKIIPPSKTWKMAQRQTRLCVFA